MTTVTDVTTVLLSGLNHIDALLDDGPGWNFLINANNTLKYTFSISTANETGVTGQAAFNATQQAAARQAFAYLASVTGIQFVETSDGTAADLHLCYQDIKDSPTTAGLCSWSYNYFNDSNNNITSYTADAYVYLDNAEWVSDNSNLAAGGNGYETLLHELGHALGLKHPFEGSVTLPASTDTTANTLMSYTSSGGPYSTFSQYDIAALNWLYGRDGLGGALGVGSTTGARYFTGTSVADTLTGTAFDDTLEGDGGNDIMNGGAGTDTAVFGGLHTGYTVTQSTAGVVTVAGQDGTDTLSNFERLRFSDGTYTIAQLLTATSVAAPTESVSVNAAGYVSGNTPVISGTAQASTTVKVYNGTTLLGSAVADAKGAWSLTASTLADASYSITATATDSNGNVSPQSAALAFKVDVHAPAVPVVSVVKDSSGLVSGNQPAIAGTAEAGATVQVSFTNGLALSATAASDGKWSVTPNPLANGSYTVSARATDAAGNQSTLTTALTFSVSSSLNQQGTSGADSLVGTSGNNVLDGGAGIDTVAYGAPRANFTITKTTGGFLVTDNVGSNGIDLLANVERIKFGDKDIAIDVAVGDHGGQAYRIYQAAFDRAPDIGGLSYWMSALDKGQPLSAVAAGFIASPEFTSMYGNNSTNDHFVTLLYQHVLHRAPEQAGYDYWVSALNAGAARAQVLTDFSEGFENVAQVVGTIQNGFEYNSAIVA